MTPVALVLAVGACVAVVLTLAAVVELFKDVQQVRVALGLMDSSEAVDVSLLSGVRLDSIGLIKSPATRWLLVLSDKCTTCVSIGQDIAGAIPATVQILVIGARGFPGEFLKLTSLSEEDVVVDSGGELAYSLGIVLTPLLLELSESTHPTSGYSVSSARQVLKLIRDNSGIKKQPTSLAKLVSNTNAMAALSMDEVPRTLRDPEAASEL